MKRSVLALLLVLLAVVCVGCDYPRVEEPEWEGGLDAQDLYGSELDDIAFQPVMPDEMRLDAEITKELERQARDDLWRAEDDARWMKFLEQSFECADDYYGVGSAACNYVASYKREPFHYPWCKWAQKIAPGNRVCYETREQAIADGHRPCKVCNP